jgi:hypothetical protein
MTDDRRLPSLRSAREKLCVAQTDLKSAYFSRLLQDAIDIVDRVGVYLYPTEWSSHNDPATELDRD